VSQGPGLAAALAELRVVDLYLACACQHGVGAAISRFDSVFAALGLQRGLHDGDAAAPPADAGDDASSADASAD
jgi:hypothetical protein